MKKYRYTIKGAWLVQLTHWTDKGLEDLESYTPCNPTFGYETVYFDTLSELEQILRRKYYWVDFMTDDPERITVRWYTTEDDMPVKFNDSDWKLWSSGDISLWEHVMDIEPSDIYLNQTINSFNEIQP